MKLEDGEIVIDGECIYQRCPKCDKLVPKIADGLSLLDLRGCTQGSYNLETKEVEVFISCVKYLCCRCVVCL